MKFLSYILGIFKLHENNVYVKKIGSIAHVEERVQYLAFRTCMKKRNVFFNLLQTFSFEKKGSDVPFLKIHWMNLCLLVKAITLIGSFNMTKKY